MRRASMKNPDQSIHYYAVFWVNLYSRVHFTFLLPYVGTYRRYDAPTLGLDGVEE